MLTPTWTADAHANNTYIAEAFLQDTGWTQRQLLGREWEKCIHPEDMPLALNGYLHSLTHHDRFNSMYRLRTNTGKSIMVQVVTEPRYVDGEFRVSGVVLRVD